MNNGRQSPPPLMVPRSAATAAIDSMRGYGMRPVGGRPPAGGVPDMSQSAGPPGMGLEPHIFHEPGGDVIRQLQHPAFETIEELYRVLPEGGWFSPNLSATNPIQFELGAFTVPKAHQFWLMFYEFQIFVQSGLDAGDIVPAAPGRFSGNMGFDVTVMGRRISHLLYQIDPVPVQDRRQTFDPPTGARRTSPDEFNRAAFASFASTASPGLSLLPVRPEIQGVPSGPFTFICEEGSPVGLSCVLFRTVTNPIATIQGRLAGYLIHTNTSQALVQRMRPR